MPKVEMIMYLGFFLFYSKVIEFESFQESLVSIIFMNHALAETKTT